MRTPLSTVNKDTRFKPGQSGNPKGCPRSRCYLWYWICKYMEMTHEELGKESRKHLKAVQRIAMKLVKAAMAGKYCKATPLARYVIDRTEGKPIEHIIVEDEDRLTDEECEAIREEARQRMLTDTPPTKRKARKHATVPARKAH